MYREYSTKSPSSRRERHRNKIAVLKMYGLGCRYCGTDKYEVLSIDHIRNDGKVDRAEKRKMGIATGSGMWRYLARSKYQPEKYQILCHNCNVVKEQYKIFPGGNDYKPISWWEDFSKKRTYDKKGKVLECIDCHRKKYFSPSNLHALLQDAHRCQPCRIKNHKEK